MNAGSPLMAQNIRGKAARQTAKGKDFIVETENWISIAWIRNDLGGKSPKR